MKTSPQTCLPCFFYQVIGCDFKADLEGPVPMAETSTTTLENAGTKFDTYAKVIVNVAGPFCDPVRKMANKVAKPMISPGSGVHIVLPDYYSHEGMGLIVPKTKDGRVIFMLPWLGGTVAGT